MSSQVLLVNWPLRYQNFRCYSYHRFTEQMNTRATYILGLNSYFKKAVQTGQVPSITLPGVPQQAITFFLKNIENMYVQVPSWQGSVCRVCTWIGVCLRFMQSNTSEQNHFTTVSCFQPYSQSLLLFNFPSCLLFRRETSDM